jgi:hypothetical protein
VITACDSSTRNRVDVLVDSAGNVPDWPPPDQDTAQVTATVTTYAWRG